MIYAFAVIIALLLIALFFAYRKGKKIGKVEGSEETAARAEKVIVELHDRLLLKDPGFKIKNPNAKWKTDKDSRES